MLSYYLLVVYFSFNISFLLCEKRPKTLRLASFRVFLVLYAVAVAHGAAETHPHALLFLLIGRLALISIRSGYAFCELQSYVGGLCRQGRTWLDEKISTSFRSYSGVPFYPILALCHLLTYWVWQYQKGETNRPRW